MGGEAVSTLSENHGTIDDVVGIRDAALSYVTTKGFSLEVDSDGLKVIAEEHKPKEAKRKHLKESKEFLNYLVVKSPKVPYRATSLKHMNIEKLVSELNNGEIGYVDFSKSKKTIIVNEKYLKRLKRKSKKNIRVLEKKINKGLAGRDDRRRLKDLKKIRGTKLTKMKTTDVYDSLKGTPIYLSLTCNLPLYEDEKGNIRSLGKIYVSFEPIENTRQLKIASHGEVARYGHEIGLRVNVSYRGWHKKEGREAMDKIMSSIEDNYLQPLVDKFRNQKEEQDYFNKAVLIDKVKNYEVEGDSFEGSNGLKIFLPSQDIKFKGFRKRAKKKLA